MQRKNIFLIYALILLLSLAGVSFQFIQPVKASGTIYIWADGSIDPPTSNIQRDGNVYTFTDNIHDSIIVLKNNIVIDGAGYTLEGDGDGNGIELYETIGITIRNTTIKKFDDNIHLWCSSSCNISQNNIENAFVDGILLLNASYNLLSGNTISNNHFGINLASSNNNVISDNTVTNSSDWATGIILTNSSNNTFSDNTVTNNRKDGIHVIHDSSYNTFSGNTITNNSACGMYLDQSSYNTLSDNMVAYNYYEGISIRSSSNVNMTGNDIVSNRFWGVSLKQSSECNFCHNNIVIQFGVVVDSDSHIWDDGYPSGGNYWSYHNPPDEDFDKIGDWPYVIDENNVDRYPLIYPYGFVPDTDINRDEVVNIIDISTVAMAFGCKPGDHLPNWNPIVDMDVNETINILDLSTVAMDYGKTV